MKSIFEALKINDRDKEEIDLQIPDQTESLKSLMSRLSREMGDLEAVEIKARTAKLLVAAKFAAVEKLLKQTEMVMSILIGDTPAPAIVEKKPEEKRRYTAGAKFSVEGKRRYYQNPPELIRNTVSTLGGLASSTEVIELMMSREKMTYNQARNLFYGYKDKALRADKGPQGKTMYQVCELCEM